MHVSAGEWWHGSNAEFDRFNPDLLANGALHVGTYAQARMRNSRFLYRIFVPDGSYQVSRDLGGNWAGKIRAARRKRRAGILYLNRYEGLSQESVRRLSLISDPDTLSPARFRKLAPDADNSLIILDLSAITILERIAKPQSDARRIA